MAKQSAGARWAVGTLAVVAIALSLDSLRHTREDIDGARAAPKVVRRQLDAFNRGDYRAAYQFAAPEIQAQFPLPEFRRMVETGYPQIARSRSAAFGPVQAHGRFVDVPVLVTGQDGVTVRVRYMLRHEPDGWRVAGVASEHPAGRGRPPRKPAPSARQREPDSVAVPRLLGERSVG
jgi:uncharacterized protein DUF4864